MKSSATPPPAEAAAPRNFLVDQRVRISLVLFTALGVFDFFMGLRPRHALLDPRDLQGCIGLGIVVAGLAVRGWAAGVLRKGFDLTIEGPYSLCRHPLYLGSFLMMLGFVVVIDRWHDYVVMLVPVVVIYRLTILREERRLAERYGERWTEYAARTPRFIPWKLWNYLPCDWSIAQWKKSREYQAVISTSIGLAALELWRRSAGF